MSTNSSNTVRNSYMINYTKKKKHRYILTENYTVLNDYIQKNIRKINDSINVLIQELNIKVHDRQIPYIVLEKIPISVDKGKRPEQEQRKRIRGIIRDIDNSDLLKNYSGKLLEKEMISHSIEFFVNSGYNGLTFSNIHFDVKVLSEKKKLNNVFSDIFLDSAMFNSYSFLKEMNDEDKHNFGKQKFEFYQKRKLNCYYRIDSEDNDRIFYYSLAFSCRKNDKEFDYEKYITLWNDFLNEYYNGYIHKEKGIAEQIRQYFNPNHISNKIRNQLYKKDDGAYLILRINQDKTKSLHERINTYFGIKKYEIGATKIVKIDEYYNIQDMLRNLDVSAYKIVKKSSQNKKN